MTHAILKALECAEPGCDCRRAVRAGHGLTHCPAHADHHPSLSVRERDGRVLVHCFTGCAQQSVIDALISRRLWPTMTDYRLPGGIIHRRREAPTGKQVSWHRADGQKGLAGTPTSTLLLFGSEDLDALALGSTVIVCEGEKARDGFLARGIASVGTVCGAAVIPAHSVLQPLSGLDVVLCPDNDDPGRAHMDGIARVLFGLGASPRLLVLPGLPHKGDICNWAGRDEDLARLIEHAPPLTPPAPGFPRTDAGNGELFANLHGNRVRFDHLRREWLIWRGHWWAPDVDGEVHRLTKATARHRQSLAMQSKDQPERQAEETFARKSEDRTRLDAMLNCARHEPPIANNGEGWDSDPWLLGCRNGVIDLRTGTLRAGRQDDLIRDHIGLPFDPAATAPRWTRFLAEVFDGDDEMVAFVHRVVGYCLTGDTSEQVWFLLFGAGRNGKSTFIETLRAILGPLGATLRVEALTRRATTEHPADIAALEGKRLVTISESLEDARLDEGRMKALTGQDAISARLMRQNPRTFRPLFKMLLATNHLPNVRDESDGYWARVRLIPFERQFLQAPDPHLREALLAEAPGILVWAVQGCLEWQRTRLLPPAKVMLATWKYREQQDVLGEWLEDACVLTESARVPAADAYGSYTNWAERQGMRREEVLTLKSFGTRMSRRFESKKTARGKVYLGIGLRVDPDGMTDADGFPRSPALERPTTTISPLLREPITPFDPSGPVIHQPNAGMDGVGGTPDGRKKPSQPVSGIGVRCPRGCGRPTIDGQPCFRCRATS